MSKIEEDSFDFPEFMENENCLPASNSSTTSSIFESLNSAHLFQSTSQQPTEKIQKAEVLKCSYNLHNSGGRAISPIIKSFGEDLDSKDSSNDKIVQNLVTRFENLFDYFERKQHQLNANWEELYLERAKFNQHKIIRFGIQRDEYNANAERSARVKERELELIHAKIKKLKGEVEILGKSFNEDNTNINDFSEILDNTEQENPCPQFVDESLNLFPSHTNSTFNNMEIPSLNQKFELPLEMVNTMYKLSDRGKEYTFNDGNEEVVVVEPSFCDHHYCLLYEYQERIAENENFFDNSGSKYFRWISAPILPISNYDVNKIEIIILRGSDFYKIITPDRNIIRFCIAGHLEISWNCCDDTIIDPDGERREYIPQGEHDANIEIYLPNGKAFRKSASNKWQREMFLPNYAKMSVRPNGSYSTLYSQKRQVYTETTKYSKESFLQINAKDFKLRRFNSTKAVKVVMPADSYSSGTSIEVLLSSDNSILVNYIRTKKQTCGKKRRDKYVCLSSNKCGHV
uniref:Uncharacterized protein n=2 Tax=Meloidogyne TaxID=189290 RepID=A0A914KW03_MELIC